jgi:hypothetical protein
VAGVDVTFAFGYDADRRWVTLLSAGAGLVMIGLIIFCRQWVWGLGIPCYAASAGRDPVLR